MQWPLIGVLGAATTALGIVGFAAGYRALGQPPPLGDVTYRTLQLYVLEFNPVSQVISWQLSVARFLAPALAAYTFARAFAVVFRDQLLLVRLRFYRNHVVVAGLGSKGIATVRSLRDRGRRVVAIERDEQATFRREAAALGALVVSGDATQPFVLSQARVSKASHVVALCGADTTNAEIVLTAWSLASNVSTLQCVAHVLDPDVCELLRLEALERASPNSPLVEFFNSAESGARLVIQDRGLVTSSTASVMVIGSDVLCYYVVIEACRQWHRIRDDETALEIKVFAPPSFVDSILARHPEVNDVAVVTASRGDITAPSRDTDAIFISTPDDTTSIATALELQRSGVRAQAPIVVRLLDQGHLADAIALRPRQECARIHPFVLEAATCTAPLVLGGSTETLARAMHAEYLANRRIEGDTPASNPSLVSWEDLAPALKDSNRDQATHIHTKLQAIGCHLAPLRSWNAAEFCFTDEELEMLARMEHDRWARDRAQRGWNFASGPKDVDELTSPYLVPWDLLSERIRDYDREFVRRLPAFLEQAGFEIERSPQNVQSHTDAPRVELATS